MSNKDLNWQDNIIRDGFTQRFYIKADDRRHGELRFTARPMLAAKIEETDAFVENPNTTAAQRVGRVIRVLSEHIVDWSEDEKPSLGIIAALRRPLIVKAYEMLAGQLASDDDPAWKGLPDEDDLDVAASGLSSPERLQEDLGKS